MQRCLGRLLGMDAPTVQSFLLVHRQKSAFSECCVYDRITDVYVYMLTVLRWTVHHLHHQCVNTSKC